MGWRKPRKRIVQLLTTIAPTGCANTFAKQADLDAHSAIAVASSELQHFLQLKTAIIMCGGGHRCGVRCVAAWSPRRRPPGSGGRRCIGCVGPHEAGVSIGGRAHSWAFPWSAISAGAVAAIALTLVLATLGSAFGLASVSPWPGAGTKAATFTIVAGLWLIVIRCVRPLWVDTWPAVFEAAGMAYKPTRYISVIPLTVSSSVRSQPLL